MPPTLTGTQEHPDQSHVGADGRLAGDRAADAEGSYTWMKTGGGVDFSSTNTAGAGGFNGGPLVNYVTDNTKKQTWTLKAYTTTARTGTSPAATRTRNTRTPTTDARLPGLLPYYQNLGGTNISWLSGAFANPTYKVQVLYVMERTSSISPEPVAPVNGACLGAFRMRAVRSYKEISMRKVLIATAAGITFAVFQTVAYADGADEAKEHGCVKCHDVGTKKVGPLEGRFRQVQGQEGDDMVAAMRRSRCTNRCCRRRGLVAEADCRLCDEAVVGGLSINPRLTKNENVLMAVALAVGMAGGMAQAQDALKKCMGCHDMEKKKAGRRSRTPLPRTRQQGRLRCDRRQDEGRQGPSKGRGFGRRVEGRRRRVSVGEVAPPVHGRSRPAPAFLVQGTHQRA